VRIWTTDLVFRGASAAYANKGYALSGNEDDPAGFGLWATGNGEVRQSGYYVMQDTTVRYYLGGDPAADSLAYAPWDRLPEALDAKAALNDATDPDIRPFIRRGGKLIVWHGGSDAAVSAGTTIDYMPRMEQVVGPDAAADATRLYVAPGVYHCNGGAGPDQIDLLTALDQWVTADTAPETLVAETLVSDGEPSRSLPLCRYPQYPHYTGPRNDPAAARQAANFTCSTPRSGADGPP